MTTDDDEFRCRWESNSNYVRVIHRDGDEHLMTWDGKRLGPDWMTPLAALVRNVDEEFSIAEAEKHSGPAKRAAERFVGI